VRGIRGDRSLGVIITESAKRYTSKVKGLLGGSTLSFVTGHYFALIIEGARRKKEKDGGRVGEKHVARVAGIRGVSQRSPDLYY